MRVDEISTEMEKLRDKKVELASKLSTIRDLDEKEEVRLQIERLQKQIDTLERFKKKI